MTEGNTRGSKPPWKAHSKATWIVGITWGEVREAAVTSVPQGQNLGTEV